MEHYLPVFITDSALHELDLIRNRRECFPGGNEPFFMWCSYLLPHVPCVPPEPYFSMYSPDDMPELNKTEKELNTFSRQVEKWRKEWSFIDNEKAQKLRAQYLGCVSLIDEQIGRIIQQLKELNIYDNTLIVFSSDHGDYLGDHHMQQKGFFHDCSSKVPLIFSGPGAAKDKKVNELVTHIDLLPTIMEYCGLTLERKGIEIDISTPDAVSLVPALGTGELSKGRIIVSESGICGYSVMMRQGNLKIVYYEDTGKIDIFDLCEDPEEQNNLGKDKTRQDIPEQFSRTLEQVLNKIEKYRNETYYHNGKRRRMFT
jgi:arylsulfatase A-like enzyme